jgi:AcrR family transcriptional regulator
VQARQRTRRFAGGGKEIHISRRYVFNTPRHGTIENVSSTTHMLAQPTDGDFRNRPRRRGAVLEQAILGAAWEELTQVGYRDLTIEGVAARAQTGKQAIYRRWSGRARLVIAAMREYAPAFSGQVPDTGELRADVLALLRRAAERWEQLGPETIHGMLAEVVEDPEHEALINGRTAGEAAMRTILERAAVRGEINLDQITPRIVALPVDLLRHELLVTSAPVPDALILEIVDEVFLPLAYPYLANSDRRRSRRRPRPTLGSRSAE